MLRLRTYRQLQYETASIPVSGFTVLCHNARSLLANIEHYRHATRLADVRVFIVQETWATENDPAHYYALNGFQDPVCLYTGNGQHRPHSGTFVYVKNGVHIQSSHLIKHQGIEAASLVVSDDTVQYQIITI